MPKKEIDNEAETHVKSVFYAGSSEFEDEALWQKDEKSGILLA